MTLETKLKVAIGVQIACYLFIVAAIIFSIVKFDQAVESGGLKSLVGQIWNGTNSVSK